MPGASNPVRSAPILRCLALAAVLIMTAGCAGLRLIWAQDPLEQLEQALEEGDYNSARRIVDHLPRRHEDHDAVREQAPRVAEQIRQFERERIAAAERDAEQGRWRQAVETIDAAIEKWSRSTALSEARSRLEQEQFGELLRVRARLVAREAHWMARHQAEEQELARFSEHRTEPYRERSRERREWLLRELEEISQALAEREDWPRAYQVLAAARELHPDREWPLLEEAERRVERESAQRRARRGAELRRRAREELDRYEDNGAVEHLLHARGHITDANSMVDMTAERQRLERLIDEHVRQQLSHGDQLYARGDYRDAREVWEALVPLAPEHPGLASRLDRMERVLRSLERLEGG